MQIFQMACGSQSRQSLKKLQGKTVEEINGGNLFLLVTFSFCSLQIWRLYLVIAVLADRIYCSFMGNTGPAHSCSKCHSPSTLTKRYPAMMSVSQKCHGLLLRSRSTFEKRFSHAVAWEGGVLCSKASATCHKCLGWIGSYCQSALPGDSHGAWACSPGWRRVGADCEEPPQSLLPHLGTRFSLWFQFTSLKTLLLAISFPRDKPSARHPFPLQQTALTMYAYMEDGHSSAIV